MKGALWYILKGEIQIGLLRKKQCHFAARLNYPIFVLWLHMYIRVHLHSLSLYFAIQVNAATHTIEYSQLLNLRLKKKL